MICLVCEKEESGTLWECGACQLAMVRQLRELEDYCVILSLTSEPSRTGSGRGSPGYGSKPPVNLDKLIALDPRSMAGDVDEYGDQLVRRWGDSGQWTRSIVGGLIGIAAWLREERDELPIMSPTLVGTVNYLRGITGWMRGQQYVDEVAKDIKELHQQARQLAGDRPPGPMGACLSVTCDGVVFPVMRQEDPRETAGRCDCCQRVYSGLDLVRLAAAQEVAG